MNARAFRFWVLPTLAVIVLAVVGVRVLRPASNNVAARSTTPTATSTSAPASTSAPVSGADAERTISSAYYTFTLIPHTGLVPPAERRRAGGSLTTLDNGFLLVTAVGDFYHLSRGPDTDTLQADRLPLSAPFNRDALLKVSGPGAVAPFRITDLLVDDRGGITRVYVAHHHWDSTAHCVSLRVSSTVLPATGGSPDPAARWDTVFDSQPCLPVGTMWPMGEQADRSGGRLARHDLGLLLSVGDHGFDGLEDVASFPQAPDSSYGKILLLDMAGGAAPFSIGHRNPAGLTVDRQGRVWSTEHGPEGGDELNLVVRGGNYGWPLVTYGTDYHSSVWPLAANSRTHGQFREPALAFVPAVGVSQLLQVGAKYLPRWSGDLLLSSLQAGKLFRVRMTGDKVVYTEPIDLSLRIRDLAEGADGRLLIWDDDGRVVSLVLADEPLDP